MFDSIFCKGQGFDGVTYCDLIIKAEFAVAFGFGANAPGQAIVCAVVSYNDRSFFSTEVTGVVHGRAYNDLTVIDRSDYLRAQRT